MTPNKNDPYISNANHEGMHAIMKLFIFYREILQDEFDVCVRLDKKWTQLEKMEVDLYAKLYCWSLIKWNKIVYLDPNCLVMSFPTCNPFSPFRTLIKLD
jgi:hypothetical protein